jgi:enoyl-CoA hydratase/carnithine racemase
MSAFATIAYEVADEIATITLDRPDRLNALDPTMERELLQVWDLVDADDAVRAVVVTGRGRAFCAGADLSDAGAGFDVVRRAQMRGTEELRPGDVPRDSGGLISLRLFRCLRPVIAAINGAGVGFGATFPLPMDARLASETARFGFVFSRRGMCMDGAAMVGAVTEAMVDELAVAGTPDEVAEQLRRFDGVVDEVVLSPPTFRVAPERVAENLATLTAHCA